MGRMNLQIETALKQIESMPFQNILPQVNKIKELLARGCDVDGQDANGDTLLHILVKSGQFRGHNTIEAGDNKKPRPENVFDISYLLKYNPNPLIENKQGLTPAMLAAHLKLTTEWQFLSSYEQKYVAKETANVLSSLYLFMQAVEKQTKKSASRTSATGVIDNILNIQEKENRCHHVDISRSIYRLCGNKSGRGARNA